MAIILFVNGNYVTIKIWEKYVRKSGNHLYQRNKISNFSFNSALKLTGQCETGQKSRRRFLITVYIYMCEESVVDALRGYIYYESLLSLARLANRNCKQTEPEKKGLNLFVSFEP